MNEENVQLAPVEYRRPKGYDPIKYRYKYSIKELGEKYSEKFMERAKQKYDSVQLVIAQGKWKATSESIDAHQCPEWFQDMKFGMFIDWGLWSVSGWGIHPQDNRVPVYPDHYEEHMYWLPQTISYHEKNWGKDFRRDDFIPLFSDKLYDPGKLVDLAVKSGMKYIIPFAKHHSGFCLWPSSFTHRNVSEMISSEKDFIKPIVEGCKKNGLKFGFYFSVEDWEYPIIDEKGILGNRLMGGKIVPYDIELETKASGKIPVKNYAEEYLLPQAVDAIDRYDPDILWYDGDWDTKYQALKTYDVAAYYYNQAEGRKEVAVNDRYGLEGDKMLRSRRGDFFTSEYHDMKDENKQHPWEECRGISQFFGYCWRESDANVLTTPELLNQFLKIVSKGGNLLLIVNLDRHGGLPNIQKKRMKDMGKWLEVNKEGIYGTRAYIVNTENEDRVYYTRSKDKERVYAISMGWPGKQLVLESVVPQTGSEIYMLGYDKPLLW
ncbi:MAG: alpha-L-fucosidase, partial [Bacteroidales bacterium]